MRRTCSGRVIFRPLAMAILCALALAVSVALPGVSADGGGDKKKDTDQGQDQAPPIPEKRGLTYPNLGSHLDQLVAKVEEGVATPQDAAGEAPMHQGELVAVTIYLSGSVDEVVKFLEENGGDPRNVGDDYAEAYVPVSLLGPVSERPGVLRVREIVPPQPGQSAQRVAGHGPAAHLSGAWNLAGYTGQGVKVGIIDTGFEGFSGLVGTELPATVVARCYTDIGEPTPNLADCEAGSGHGTRVAESLVDIAPEVSLYISNGHTKGDLQTAVDWMIAEGVSVINTSLSWTSDGPGDGKSPFGNSPLNTVDRAVAGGVVWVNSAGNYARSTWFGVPSSFGPIGSYMYFAGTDLRNDMSLEAGDVVRAELRWDDSWEGATTDLNICIFHPTVSGVGECRFDIQSGKSGEIPHEFLRYRVPVEGDWYIVVSHQGGSVPDWIQLVVTGDVGSIEHYTKNGSITNPAESANQGMLAVGAAHWDDVRAIEPYSSRGPTPDGRVKPKPDVVGAACGATSLTPLNEYNSGFCGTSQAAPHVAGLAALVRQRFPDYTPAQVAAYLKDNAEQRQSPDPNNTWGHGFVKLPPPDGTPPPAPVPSNSFARNPTADFNTLAAAFNTAPAGIWSDGTTMWVADWFLVKKIYAYDLATRVRVPDRDFNTLDADTDSPSGIWSDGTTMWVADRIDEKIYAYDMTSKARVHSREFDTLIAAGNTWPTGIWSDGTTMWVADKFDGKIYAYDLATKARVPGKDFDSLNARNRDPEGIWSDGETMWVVDDNRKKIYAYDMGARARVPGKEFNTLDASGNENPEGIWSDGTTMWVSDWNDEKIYAYHMPQAVESAADREALDALYNATGGTNWTNNANWLTNTPIGQWHGVTTGVNGRVTNLALNDNQLSGTIPAQLGNLTSLQELHLTRNQLTGTIPAELGSLTSLEILALGANELTGDIPPELGSLSNLERMYLWDNELTGPIPAELGSLSNLQELWLSENQLTGEIPTELSRLASLVELGLWGNELTGGIPSWLGDLSKLEVLSLSRNGLAGGIPSELGNLANLKKLVLNENEFTGNIPAWLGSLTNLEEVYLWGNGLSGTIPAELGRLANLELLSLSRNELTGGLPPELGGLASLEELHLTRNRLSGAIPPEFSRLTSLTILALGGNQLTGSVPTWLGSLTTLEGLYLWGNELTGPIPAEMGSISNLAQLELAENQLTGEIPPELGSLSNLEEMHLWGNGLTGTIPTQLGSLSNLEELSLSNNQLTGVVPRTLSGLAMLEYFGFYNNPSLCAPVDEAFQTWLRGIGTVYGSSCAPVDSPEDRAVLEILYNAAGGADWTNKVNWLSDRPTREWYGVTTDANGRVNGLFLWENQLTGAIPAELGNLSNLTYLSLRSNQLTGAIPAELGNLSNLTYLSLRSNQLTGAIPAELGNLTNLVHLRLDGNQLTGEIPAALGRLRNLTALYLSGNRVTGCVPASLRGVDDNDFAQIGLSFCPGDPLITEYDTNRNGRIDRSEVIQAINDYLFGGEGSITRADVIRLINLYLFGPTPQHSEASGESGGGQQADPAGDGGGHQADLD